MADDDPRSQQIAAMRQSFFDQGILDRQFVNLERLTDEETPHFLEEIFDLYFRDCPVLMNNIERAIRGSPLYNDNEVERLINRLKGSTASVGAAGVLREVNKIREFWIDGNLSGAEEVIPLLRGEYSVLKSRLEGYFEMIRGGASSGRPQSPREEINLSDAPASPDDDSSPN